MVDQQRGGEAKGRVGQGKEKGLGWVGCVRARVKR